jgi:hypothetical protein
MFEVIDRKIISNQEAENINSYFLLDLYLLCREKEEIPKNFSPSQHHSQSGMSWQRGMNDVKRREILKRANFIKNKFDINKAVVYINNKIKQIASTVTNIYCQNFTDCPTNVKVIEGLEHKDYVKVP